MDAALARCAGAGSGSDPTCDPNESGAHPAASGTKAAVFTKLRRSIPAFPFEGGGCI
jgi:hypothetical protein